MTIERLGFRPLAVGLWTVSAFFVLLMPVSFLHGFPAPFLSWLPFHVKSLRKLFEAAFVFYALGVACHPGRGRHLTQWRTRLISWATRPGTLWILAGVYFLLFLWEQITKYLSLEINFIPFLFYDYMLWYFDQGKFCYTGMLHGFYHVNLILLLLYPVWKLVQSPWVLHVAHAFLGAFAVVPFYYWSRGQLKKPWMALSAAFVYLNFRTLQNIMLVNFSVEVFYPVLIFAAVYFAFKKQESFYYLSVIMGLLVKEDSAIYFGGLGLFFLFTPSERKRGLWTLLLSVVYLVWVLKVFLPWSDSTILRGDLKNFSRFLSGGADLSERPLLLPLYGLRQLVWPLKKLETLLKLTSRLLLLPFFSPWVWVGLWAAVPLFLNGGEYFVKLAFYYGAPVLPFFFLAFVDGWRRVQKFRVFKRRAALQWGMVALLVFLNGFNLQSRHFTRDDLLTIRLAKSIAPNRIVVTQGHLLPYLGYRVWNFYLSEHYEKNPVSKEAYSNPDYYFFDFEADPYPNRTEQIREKADALRDKRRFLIVHEDHRRLLVKRIKK